MDWTYFASKRFQVSEFQREAATKPVVVPMSKAATIAVKAKRGTETRVADIKRLLSQINQAGSVFAASCIAMRFHTRC
jgi:hypothetical protein